MQKGPHPGSLGEVRPCVPAIPLLSAPNQSCTTTQRCKCRGRAVSSHLQCFCRARRRSGLWGLFQKYWCWRAAWAVMRLLGSYRSNCCQEENTADVGF